MSEFLTERPYQYEVSIPGNWAAFFMYLCVNADKAWEVGLAGSSIAEQLCNILGLPYSRPEVVASISAVKFSRITLVVDYREINELTKFSQWCREEIGPTIFGFIDGDNNVRYLNSDSLSRMRVCLGSWRNNFRSIGRPMPIECGDIFF